MYNPFTKHPKEVNETYFEHMCCAMKFHCTLLKLSLCALIHAVFPFLFEQTGGDEIEKINNDLQNRRSNERELD